MPKPIDQYLKDPTYQEGIQSAEKGDFPGAARYFQKCIEEDPENYLAWNNLGAVEFNQGNQEAAEKGFLKSHNLNLQYEEAMLNLVDFYLTTQNYAQGTAVWYHLLLHNPDHAELNSLEKALNKIQPRVEIPGSPLVSIVMATYNRRDLLPLSIGSVLKQTYPHFELLLVNDGGEDVSDIVQAFGDQRIRYFNLPDNFGTGHSFNKALFESQGEFITYLGDDDLFYPHHLETLLRSFEKEPEREVFYSDFYVTECQRTPEGYGGVTRREVQYSLEFDPVMLIAETNYIIHMSYLHRRSVFKKTGYYDESLKCLIDWDFFRRLAFYTEFKHVPVVTGEWMNPVNTDTGRVSSLLNKNPEAWQEQQRRLLLKRPPEPWVGIKKIKCILHTEEFNNQTITTLNDLISLSGYPMDISVFINNFSEGGKNSIDEIPYGHIHCYFLPNPLKEKDLLKNLMRLIDLQETTFFIGRSANLGSKYKDIYFKKLLDPILPPGIYQPDSNIVVPFVAE